MEKNVDFGTHGKRTIILCLTDLEDSMWAMKAHRDKEMLAEQPSLNHAKYKRPLATSLA